jgi:hypothetical protein
MAGAGYQQPNRIDTVGRLVFGPKTDVRVNDHERPERVDELNRSRRSR